jgi:hypothetical protein
MKAVASALAAMQKLTAERDQLLCQLASLRTANSQKDALLESQRAEHKAEMATLRAAIKSAIDGAMSSARDQENSFCGAISSEIDAIGRLLSQGPQPLTDIELGRSLSRFAQQLSGFANSLKSLMSGDDPSVTLEAICGDGMRGLLEAFGQIRSDFADVEGILQCYSAKVGEISNRRVRISEIARTRQEAEFRSRTQFLRKLTDTLGLAPVAECASPSVTFAPHPVWAPRVAMATSEVDLSALSELAVWVQNFTGMANVVPSIAPGLVSIVEGTASLSESELERQVAGLLDGFQFPSMADSGDRRLKDIVGTRRREFESLKADLRRASLSGGAKSSQFREEMRDFLRGLEAQAEELASGF